MTRQEASFARLLLFTHAVAHSILCAVSCNNRRFDSRYVLPIRKHKIRFDDSARFAVFAMLVKQRRCLLVFAKRTAGGDYGGA